MLHGPVTWKIVDLIVIIFFHARIQLLKKWILSQTQGANKPSQWFPMGKTQFDFSSVSFKKKFCLATMPNIVLLLGRTTWYLKSFLVLKFCDD